MNRYNRVHCPLNPIDIINTTLYILFLLLLLNLIKKRKRAVFSSSSFYSNLYKMCLCITILKNLDEIQKHAKS